MNAIMVSVVTVCRNAGPRIDATAASVVAQRLVDCEWLVVDGASTDDTVQRVEAWRERCPGAVKIVSEPDAGVYDAMNKGLRLARGKWVLFLNAGDALADAGALSALLAEAGENRDLVIGRIRLLDPRDGFESEAGEAFSWEGVARGRVPPHPACLYAREAALRAGGYPDGFDLAADAVLTLRVAAGGKVRFVARVISVYPTDGLSSRFDWSWRVHREKARAIHAAAPPWVGHAYARRWPLEAMRATMSHLLAKCGLLRAWRRIKRAF